MPPLTGVLDNFTNTRLQSTTSKQENTMEIANENGSYWSDNGKYQSLAGELQKLVPATGKVQNSEQNPALERFRLYANAYYDIFNNGGWNYAKDIYRWFPGAMSLAKRDRWDEIYAITEPRMDKVILAAAREQGLINNVEAA